MSLQKQFRRDTDTNLMAATPAAGEPGFNTTTGRFHIGDGATAGGIILPNAKDIQIQSFVFATVGGTANALTLTVPGSPTLTAGLAVEFIPTSANTGSVTGNVNGLGAVTFKKNSSGTLASLAANDFPSGIKRRAVYDGTYFQVSIDQASGLSSVSQGNLNTSTGSVSGSVTAASTANFSNAVLLGTLPGGEYAFGFEVNRSGAGGQATFGLLGNSTSSYARKAYGVIVSSGSSFTVAVQERYITASPPFDMGDGEVAGFIFARVNKAGEIVGAYVADVPPWAYNGPTSIRADKIDPITGKKYRRVVKDRSIEEIMGGAGVEYSYEEITHAIKNADMPLIPHPFQGLESPDETIVLLNPKHDRLADLLAHQNAGGNIDISDALHSGKIYADNEFLNMKGPPGVKIAPLRFKYTR